MTNRKIDHDFLIKNYSHFTAKYFADKFDVNIYRIYSLATKYKLTSTNNWNSQKNEIISDYIGGKSLDELGDKYGHYESNIKQKLIKWKVKIRTASESHCLYEFDKSFFKKIDTQEKAYWLGFIYADGNIYINKNNHKYVFQICLSERDRSHIEKLKTSFKSTHLIYKDKIGPRFMINSIEFVNDLIKLGAIPNKSLILKFPTDEQVPSYLLNHFIRGYFDGDGSISYSEKRNRWIFQIIGTLEFLSKIKDIFMYYGVSDCKLVMEKRSGHKKIFYLTYGGAIKYKNNRNNYKTNNCKIIYNYIYNNFDIFLNRKKEKFDNLIKIKELNDRQ